MKQIPYYSKDPNIRYDMVFTDFLLDVLVKFVSEASSRKYLISGGIAIDLTYGEIVRPHEDLDILPEEKDYEFWLEWFQAQGLKVINTPDTINYPYAFVVVDKDDNYVADVYSVKFKKSGKLLAAWQENNAVLEYQIWENTNFLNAREIKFNGIEVVVEDYKDVIAQKYNHSKKYNVPLEGKHLIDIETAKQIEGRA